MGDVKPAPGYAPVYAAMYPELVKIAREYGYALAIHGSLQRDFDLVAIPWVAFPGLSKDMLDAITKHFCLEIIGEPTQKPHGRIAYILSVGWGECAIDLSFMPQADD